MTNELPNFQQYQLAFTARLRDARNQPVPTGVAPERMAVYDEIVFNNMLESVSACFPVARKTLGKATWLKLVQAFLKEHSANSPLFRKIPEEFLAFLQHTNLVLPPYLQALCHYEWIELYLSALPAPNHQDVDMYGDIAHQALIFTQAMQLLAYDYAVHKISPRQKPKVKEPSYLLVHRDVNDKIKFIELNPMTFKLITLLKSGEFTAEQALTMLADELKHPQPQIIMQFGLGVLLDLKNQGIILGTAPL
ncbi:DNA-binding domain-containing protein [Methylotenera sp.]|uniref:HvfC family RiPP maturation protein n=1 Tax=Methylotenera sp. TaxID=2051956 RepID=UPI002EDA90D1